MRNNLSIFRESATNAFRPFVALIRGGLSIWSKEPIDDKQIDSDGFNSLLFVPFLLVAPIFTVIGFLRAVFNADEPIDYLWYPIGGLFFSIFLPAGILVTCAAYCLPSLIYTFMRDMSWRGKPSPFLDYNWRAFDYQLSARKIVAYLVLAVVWFSIVFLLGILLKFTNQPPIAKWSPWSFLSFLSG